jgi:hypothetical protein
VGGEDASKVEHIGSQLLFIFAFAMPGLDQPRWGAPAWAGHLAVLYIMVTHVDPAATAPAALLAIVQTGSAERLAAIVDINSRSLLMYLHTR